MLKLILQKKNQMVAILMSALFLFFLLQRIFILNSFSLDSDEIFSVNWANHCSYIDLVTSVCHDDGNPPFHFIALKTWFILFGQSDFSARLLSLFFSVGSFLILLFLMNNYLSFSGLQFTISLLFFSFSAILNYYFLYVRAYSMLIFFSLATYEYVSYFISKLNSLKREKSIIRDFFGILAIVLGCYTHYSFVIFVVFLLITLTIVFYKQKAFFIRCLKPFFVAFIFYLPWLRLFLGDKYYFWQTDIQWLGFHGWIKILTNDVIRTDENYGILLYGVFIILILLSLTKRKNIFERILLVFVFISSMLYILLLHILLPLPRYIILFIPFFFLSISIVLLVTYGQIHLLKKLQLFLLLLFFPLFIRNKNFSPYIPIEDWKGLSQELKKVNYEEKSIILVDSEWFRPVVNYYYPEPVSVECIKELARDGAKCYLSEEEFHNLDVKRVLFVDFYQVQKYQDFFDERFIAVSQTPLEGMVLKEYVKVD